MNKEINYIKILKKIIELDERMQSSRHNIVMNYIHGFKRGIYNQHEKNFNTTLKERRRL
ncbi:hypothetical protein LCGC14_2842370, partial [marine sediment metagenome]